MMEEDDGRGRRMRRVLEDNDKDVYEDGDANNDTTAFKHGTTNNC
jgi:hypothetical protein